jgi:hypothetical protein
VLERSAGYDYGMKAKTKYYHTDLEVFPKGDRWAARLVDPLKNLTVNEESTDADPESAKAKALSVAHGHLTASYPEQSWPVLTVVWDPSN